MPWGDNNKGQGPWGGNQPPKKDQNDIDDIINKSREKVQRFMNNGGGNGNKGGNNGGGQEPIQFGAKSFMVIGLLGFVAWMSTGVYQVAPEEEGVVLRFGKFQGSTGPGLHYHLPRPIEKVIKVPVTTLNSVEIGRFRDKKNLRESLMVTGDANIVDLDFNVQWRIADAYKYLFEVQNPEATVKAAAESAMREVVGQNPITDVLTENRSRIEQEAQKKLQSYLNAYNAGISIERIQLGEVDPPTQVIEAYRDVQDAETEQGTKIKAAEAYENKIIPRARGEGEVIMQKADAYAKEVVANATGTASRFVEVYNEYRKAKDVTKQRIYLETMEEVMGGMDKIILDQQGGVMPYLPINELRKKKD